MRNGPAKNHSLAAFTLSEVLITMGISGLLMGVMMTALVSIRRTAEATNHYILETNNANRMLDYVATDLNRAVRVGQLVGGVNTVFKNQTGFSVTEGNVLTLNLPDYYASNTPNNVEGSSFKTGRNARAGLGSSGFVPWTDAVQVINGRQIPRFAPLASGSDEIQVRYYRAKRSGGDGTVCYFRREFSVATGAALSPGVEVAEQVIVSNSITDFVLSGFNDGKVFRIESSFTPLYKRRGFGTGGTKQVVDASVFSPRRDL